MRKYLVLSVLGACLLVVALGTAAFAGSSTTPSSPTPSPTASPSPTPTPTPRTTYAGKNSQGQKLRFAVIHTASGPKFEPLLISQIVRCPATHEMIVTGDVFRGFQAPIRNGKFNFVLNDLDQLLRWSGTVTSTGASGKESIDLASFDKEGGLQDCGAGSLSWTAKAVAPGSPAAAAPSAGYIIKFTKASDGSVHFSVTH